MFCLFFWLRLFCYSYCHSYGLFMHKFLNSAIFTLSVACHVINLLYLEVCISFLVYNFLLDASLKLSCGVNYIWILLGCMEWNKSCILSKVVTNWFQRLYFTELEENWFGAYSPYCKFRILIYEQDSLLWWQKFCRLRQKMSVLKL